VVYEWDAGKAAANLKKHRVSFTEAVGVFLDPLAVTYQDPDHSQDEQRYIANHPVVGSNGYPRVGARHDYTQTRPEAILRAVDKVLYQSTRADRRGVVVAD